MGVSTHAFAAAGGPLSESAWERSAHKRHLPAAPGKLFCGAYYSHTDSLMLCRHRLRLFPKGGEERHPHEPKVKLALPACLGPGTRAPKSCLSHGLQGRPCPGNSSGRSSTLLPFVSPWDSPAGKPRTWGLKNASPKPRSRDVEYRMSRCQVRVSCGRPRECQLVAGTQRASRLGCAATMDEQRSICSLSFFSKTSPLSFVSF